MGGENGINSIKDTFMICLGTKLTQKLFTMQQYYPNDADHLSSVSCLGISKHVQIPPHLKKQNVVTKGMKEYMKFMRDLPIM